MIPVLSLPFNLRFVSIKITGASNFTEWINFSKIVYEVIFY